MHRTRFIYILGIINEALPIGLGEWTKVGQLYMARKKKLVTENETIRVATGKKGTKKVHSLTVAVLKSHSK